MKVTIEIDDSHLYLLPEYKIITPKDDTKLNSYISHFSELSNYSQDGIRNLMKKAIKEQTREPEELDEYLLDYAPGTPLGISVHIHLGRSPNTDMRTYELIEISIVPAKDADMTVDQYLNNP